MKEKSELTFRLTSVPIQNIVLMCFLLAWIAFAIYSYNINSIFFAISGSIAILIFFNLTIHKIALISTDKITIRHEKLIPLLTESFNYEISSIEYIKLETMTVPWFLKFLKIAIGPHGKITDSTELLIKERNKELVRHETFGSYVKNKELVDITLQQINTVPNIELR